MAEQVRRAAPGFAVYLRVNARASPWCEGDLELGLSSDFTGVVVPKVESADDLVAVREVLARRGLGALAVVAGIETARGVLEVGKIWVRLP